MIMEKIVYAIEYSSYTCYLNSEREDKKEEGLFGLFDTERRGICYLRRFLDETDMEYYDHTLKVTEHKDAPTSAEAIRRYKYTENECEVLITETLTMRPLEMNGLRSPHDEIILFYC